MQLHLKAAFTEEHDHKWLGKTQAYEPTNRYGNKKTSVSEHLAQIMYKFFS